MRTAAVRYGVSWCQYWDHAANQPGGRCHDLGTYETLRDAYEAYASAALVAIGFAGLGPGVRALQNEEGELVCPPGEDPPALPPYILEGEECVYPDD